MGVRVGALSVCRRLGLSRVELPRDQQIRHKIAASIVALLRRPPLACSRPSVLAKAPACTTRESGEAIIPKGGFSATAPDLVHASHL